MYKNGHHFNVHLLLNSLSPSTVHRLPSAVADHITSRERSKCFPVEILTHFSMNRTKETYKKMQSNYACGSCASCCAIQQTITFYNCYLFFSFVFYFQCRQIWRVWKHELTWYASFRPFFYTLWSMPWI